MQSTKKQATEQDLIKRLQRDLCINSQPLKTTQQIDL